MNKSYTTTEKFHKDRNQLSQSGPSHDQEQITLELAPSGRGAWVDVKWNTGMHGNKGLQWGYNLKDRRWNYDTAPTTNATENAAIEALIAKSWKVN